MHTRLRLGFTLACLVWSAATTAAQNYALTVTGQITNTSGAIPAYAQTGATVEFHVDLGQFPMTEGDTGFMAGSTWYDRPATLTFAGVTMALPSYGYNFGLSAKQIMAGQSNFLGGSYFFGLASSADVFPSQTSLPLGLTLADFDLPATENYSSWTGMPGTIGSVMNWEAQWTPTSVQVAAIPEPATWAAVCGLAALGWTIHRRRLVGRGRE